MSISTRLSLTHFIPIIISATIRKQYQDERSKLKLDIQMWKDERSESFNLKGLKTVLAQEVRWCFMNTYLKPILQGLLNMLMWINLMTQESPIKSKVPDVISRKLSTPSPSESPTEHNGSKQATPVYTSISPWCSFLYNQP